MNKNLYRLVFNQARGLILPVAENTCAQHKGQSSTSLSFPRKRSIAGHQHALPLRQFITSIGFALGLISFVGAQAGGIVVDPSAPKNQQPTVLNAGNGVPLVNIQTPSSAGVSRNVYTQFDVATQGAILNNSAGNVQTQLGGWVQGNPWLAGGTARVILNEVNASNPSLLNGFIEVAGARAQVVIANPAGISCNGCGFINASRATLTTGTPIMNGGSLDGYLVRGGIVSIGGNGLDTRGADYTDIIARAVEINAGLWANDVRITTGANRVDAGNTQATPVTGEGSAPGFAVDVAQLGGMYAGKIRLIGTESGVGVRNAGTLGASVGEVAITVDGLLVNSGTIGGATATDVTASGGIRNTGEISGLDVNLQTGAGVSNEGGIIGETVTIQASQIDNTGGGALIGAIDHLALYAANILNNTGGAVLYSGGGLQVAANPERNGDGQLMNRTASLFNESSTIEALGQLDILADTITNKRTLLTIEREATSGGYSWSKTNYYWRSWGATGFGDISPVTRTLTFNDSIAASSYYGTILSIDEASKRVLVQFQGSNTRWVYYEGLKLVGNSYELTFYEGKSCIDMGELCPYEQAVYWEFRSPGIGQYNPGQFFTADQIDYYNTSKARDIRHRTDSYQWYEDRIVANSATSSILAGGNLHIQGTLLTNDASTLSAGGSLDIDLSSGTLNNTGYSINRREVRSVWNHYDTHRGIHTYDAYNVDESHPLEAVDAIIAANGALTVTAGNINVRTESPSGLPVVLNGTVVEAGTYNPASSLAGSTMGTDINRMMYNVNPDPTQHYLIETNPKLTNYRSWLSSDIMLAQLALDPALTQKRLGDGFYEQRLVREQIAQLTGRRFLESYASDETQYRALMTNGVTVARAQQLIPGVALSTEQIAQLTTDIVWLVEQDVTLPDGQTTRALVPRVYLAPANLRLEPGGALVVGKDIALYASDSLENSGTLQADGTLAIRGNDIANRSGILAAQEVELTAGNRLTLATDAAHRARQGLVYGNAIHLAGDNIDVIGSRISGQESVQLDAAKSLNITTAKRTDTARLTWQKSPAGPGVENAPAISGDVSIVWNKVQGSALESGGTLTLNAGDDIAIRGSSLQAGDQTTLTAGGSIGIVNDVATTSMHVDTRTPMFTLHGDQTQTGVVSSRIGGDQGVTLTAQGLDARTGDLLVQGSEVASSQGNTRLTADNINIVEATASERTHTHETKNGEGKNVRIDDTVTTTAIGSRIGGKTGVILEANGRQGPGDILVTASTLESETGTVRLDAANNIAIGAALDTHDYHSDRRKSSSGFLSSKRSTEIIDQSSRTARSATLSGERIEIAAGHDLAIAGSNVVATGDVSLSAGNDVTIATVADTYDESHRTKKTGSGFAGAGIGISYGTRKLATTQDTAQTVNRGSTVGSLEGDVTIEAGKTYTQTGSDVLALKGDIDITAQRVDITAATDTTTSEQTTKFKQSGITLAINSPILNALQTAVQMKEAASQTDDPRMQALAAGTAALTAKNTYDAVLAGQPDQYGNVPTAGNTGANDLEHVREGTAADQAGGVNIALSLGTQQSSSKTTQTATTSVGSRVQAGGDVTITATAPSPLAGEGGGEGAIEGEGDITVTGSQLRAGNDLTLTADDAITLQAAQNTATLDSDNKNSSASVGISFGTDGLLFTVGGSLGKGNADGRDITWSETALSAGNTLKLTSGGDTTLQGATAEGQQVIADIGGNLTLQSLQDTSTYEAEQKSIGGSISIGYGKMGGSLSISSSETASDYASVNEQTGILAGDGGFQINVAGNTGLQGAVIASSENAVTNHNNVLTTRTLTVSNLENHANAEVDASGFGVDSGILSGSKYSVIKTLAEGLLAGSEASKSASSTTLSAIEMGALQIQDNARQLAVTGETVAEVVAGLNRDTTNTHQPLEKIDVEALEKAVQAERLIEQATYNVAVKFTDEAFRTMFLKEATVIVILKDENGNTLYDDNGKPLFRALTMEEKLNLQAGADGKIHIANNGINNTIEAAAKYADQHSTAQDGPQYFIYFPIADNGLSELLIAGYQKFMENRYTGLTNATAETINIMEQYGQDGLHIDGHSRGGLTTGNALEYLNSQGAVGSLSNSTIYLFGSAYNALQADNLLATLQNRDSITDSSLLNSMVVQQQTHQADFVGYLLGNNPATGGTIPEGSSFVEETIRIMGGENTVHGCYMSGGIDCERLWNGSTPVLSPVQTYP